MAKYTKIKSAKNPSGEKRRVRVRKRRIKKVSKIVEKIGVKKASTRFERGRIGMGIQNITSTMPTKKGILVGAKEATGVFGSSKKSIKQYLRDKVKNK